MLFCIKCQHRCRCRCRCIEGHPLLRVRNRQDWNIEFIPLLTQAASLVRSDTGSDGVGPASKFCPSKTLRSYASCGARCMGHVETT